MNNFLTFAIYFFICQVTYDVISSAVRGYFLKKELEKIRLRLEESQNKGNIWWN